jgi:Domain of unknown function (DUF4395)
MHFSALVSFPNPVNEKAARVVAGGVAMLAVLFLATGWLWVVVVLALGFLARVLSGPRFSPLGQLATRVIAPRLGPPKLVPGPPKRFAQSIGLVFTLSASLAAFFGASQAAAALVAVLLVFALLESVVGFCAGCWVFGLLMRAGVVPEQTCQDCNDISLRYPATAA